MEVVLRNLLYFNQFFPVLVTLRSEIEHDVQQVEHQADDLGVEEEGKLFSFGESQHDR